MKAPRRGGQGLLQRIRSEISAQGPMTFARFMELALYDPSAGYYSRGAGRLGTEGDFYTASDVGHAFGRCVARQIVEADGLLGAADPFDVVEFGAGRGLLARDVLDSVATLAPDLACRLSYTMVDRSASMRATATEHVPEARVADPERPPQGVRGCLLAVELFDAVPVHRVRRRQGRLVEVRVDAGDDGSLREIERPPLPEVEALARRYGVAPDEGNEAEVAPAVAQTLASMVAGLERGLVVIVDYGDSAERLADGSRPDGTLLAYRRHETNTRYLEDVGRQDLTAHVNFSVLEDQARELGLAVLGTTTQDRFLVANGIVEEFEAEAARRDAASIKRRLQAMQLIHPEGMGRRFRVLILSRGIEPPPTLRGLVDPFAR